MGFLLLCNRACGISHSIGGEIMKRKAQLFFGWIFIVAGLGIQLDVELFGVFFGTLIIFALILGGLIMLADSLTG